MSKPATASLLLGSALAALTLALHLLPIWVTMLNRGAVAWDGQPLARGHIEQVIEAHSDGSDPAFARRPATTGAIRLLGRAGIPLKPAFIATGLLGFLAAGLLVFRLALLLGATVRGALASQALFHLSPTVLMAWFDPMYTYDEPLQYAALFLALDLLLRRRWAGFALALAAALVVRETSLLLVPGFVLLAPQRRPAVLAAMASAALFGLWLAIAPIGASAADLAADAARRAGYAALNFSAARIGETIGFLLLVLLLPCFLLWQHRGRLPVRWRAAFVLALALNTPLVLMGAYAREARLLALPLVLAWPWLGPALAAEAARHGGWRAWARSLRAPWRAAALAGIAAAAAGLAYARFTLTATGQQDNLFHELLIAHIAFIAAALLAPRRAAG